ncbi:MAG: Zn-ribbon domain-containing OB-fold protein [Hyphomonadaceae bacterium]
MAEAGPDEQFRAFLREGRFMLQRARSDGRYVFYPRVAAPGDGAALDWVEASGNGRVYSTTVVRKKPPEPSYNVALIDLAEGPRMMSRVEGVAPEDVKIGMAVRARIVDGDEPFIVFEPAP